MFAINYGCRNRATEMQRIMKNVQPTAVILAAVHFEWVIKRCIMKLEEIWWLRDLKLGGSTAVPGLKKIWKQEVGVR